MFDPVSVRLKRELGEPLKVPHQLFFGVTCRRETPIPLFQSERSVPMEQGDERRDTSGEKSIDLEAAVSKSYAMGRRLRGERHTRSE